MAAYAALLSLMRIIYQIEHHPHPPISLDKQQAESLTEKLTFLQEFLEGYSLQHVGDSNEADPMEMRIADAAYEAEDVIESHIVDRIIAGSTSLDQILPGSPTLDAILAGSTSRVAEFNSIEEISSGEEIVPDKKIGFFKCFKCFRGPRKAATNQIRAGSTRHFKEISSDEETRSGEEIGLPGEISSDEETRSGEEIGLPGEIISSVDFYQDLQKVIEDMESIKKEVMEMKEKMGVQLQLHRNSISAGSLRSSFTDQNTMMVGCDDVLLEIMDKLTRGQLARQIIPIVGMGGIGKTTLARNIYRNQVVVQRFDILAWVTISQEFRMGEILLQLLQEGGEFMSQTNEYELGDELYKKLSGRRYLIIMDDIWDIQVWDQLKLFFPDNNNGSRIMLTTRQSKLALQLSGSHCFRISFLDKDESWKLLCQTVFGNESCPLQLKENGMKIARNCKGLPLSIVVIGGLLAKSKQTREYWEYILENLNSIVNLENNEHCSKILYMSYNSLPVYLKPCFLYMGVFVEDSQIRVSELIKLWVAEGFLKPIGDKSLEDVAEGYLEELVDRNILLVEECNYHGKLKLCKIHDLLRDLCLKEARKQKFLCVLEVPSLDIPQDMIKAERRICVNQHRSRKEYAPQIQYSLNALESASLARSLIWELEKESDLSSLRFRLSRVSSMVKHFKGSDKHYLKQVFMQVNLRYIHIRGGLHPFFKFPSSVSRLWNLQTLIVRCFTREPVIAPSEIWKMSQLRHIKFWRPLSLPYPSADGIVLENLQTLSDVYNFKCDKEVVKRIPNIKKLGIYYATTGELSFNYCLDNLGHLQKLESLDCFCDPNDMPSHSVQNLTFPHSLKKLALQGTRLHWEDLTTKIGSLPLLQVLKLRHRSFIGSKWETIEGRFCSLKFLLISSCNDLEYWTTDNTHFPSLERLVLGNLENLKEIPSSIGDIPTLQSIRLDCCGDSAVDSAKRIQEEQEELGNEGLQVSYRIL